MLKIYPEYPGPILLRYLSEPERKKLLELTEVYEFSTGEQVIYDQDSEAVLYLVEEGKVEVVTTRDGYPSRVATLDPGDLFGEVAFLSSQRRTADVYALSSCKIRFFEAERIGKLLEWEDGIAARFYYAINQILSKRLAAVMSKANDPASSQSSSEIPTASDPESW